MHTRDSFSIRINTLKIRVGDFKQSLRKDLIQFQELNWCKYALILMTDKSAFFDSSYVRDGYCYVQNLSSLIPGIILDPKPGELVLDLCAAPGGKTSHLGQLMENQGSILANDVSRTRLYKLEDLMNRYGVSNVSIKQSKGEDLWWKNNNRYKDYFDKILVDAPCSMNQELKGKVVKSLARRQQFLLRSALTCLKPGGRLVYATCTSTMRENEDVIDWIIEKETNVMVERLQLHPHLQTFVTADNYIRIPGNHEFDPFFTVSLVKNAE